MKNNILNTSLQLDQWIIDHSDYLTNDNLISMLALSQLCSITTGSFTKSTAHLKLLISGANNLDFSSGTLISGILSAIFVTEHGTEKQKTDAVDYLTILSDVNPDAMTINAAILKAVFKESSVETLPVEIDQIPLFEIDISAMIGHTLTQTEILSMFGTREIAADFIFRTKIEGMAIHAMRIYDLTTAMRCLRALKYIKQDKNLVFRIGTDYIFQQQCYDGSFGDFDTALSVIEDSAKNAAIRMAIKLDAAFQMMWTLFEISDSTHNLMQHLQTQTLGILQQNKNASYAE